MAWSGVMATDPRGQPVCGVVEHGGGAAQAAGRQRLAAARSGDAGGHRVSAMVAASRTRLASLVAASLLGRNAPRRSRPRRMVRQIWAQDVAAMFGYHSAASAVARSERLFQEGLQQQLQNVLELRPGQRKCGVGNISSDQRGQQTSASEIRRRQHRHRDIGGRNLGIGNTGNWNIGIGTSGGQIGFDGLPTPTSWW